MLCQTPACTAEHTDARQKAITAYQTALGAYQPLVRDPEERDLYQKFSSKFSQYLELSGRANSLLVAGKMGDALDLLAADSTLAMVRQALDAAGADFERNAKIGSDSSLAATEASRRAPWIDGIVSLIIVSLCALTGILLTQMTAPRIAAATARPGAPGRQGYDRPRQCRR